MASLQVVAAEATTVAGLIDRERRSSRWGLLWISLTVVALVVAGISLSALWPPRPLTNELPTGIHAPQ